MKAAPQNAEVGAARRPDTWTQGVRRRWLQVRRSAAAGWALAGGMVSVATVVSAALEALLPLPLPNISLVYLTAVLVVSLRTTLAPAIGAALMSFLAYNFFFTAPRIDLQMHNTGEIVTVAFFLVMALIGGKVANRLRAQMAALQATNDQSRTLLALNKQLAGASSVAELRQLAVEAIRQHAGVPVCLLPGDPEEGTLPGSPVSAPGAVHLENSDLRLAQEALRSGQPTGFAEQGRHGVPWRFLPLHVGESRHGVLGVCLGALKQPPGSEQIHLLDAMVNQVTLTLARAALREHLNDARLAEERERLRSALLSSVSHDLRTPLSSMIGSASTLRDLGEQISDENKRELLDALLAEGQRLNRYIENLLDMTRIGHGEFRLERDWVSAADIVGSALRRTRDLVAGLRLERHIPPELPLLYVHPTLVEQALVNVIENAARFSPRGGRLFVAVRQGGGCVEISVSDQGPGIAEQDRERVFDLLFTGARGDTATGGRGLGLAICRGIVTAHGGSVRAEAGPGGLGTTITLRLPLTEPPVPAAGAVHGN